METEGRLERWMSLGAVLVIISLAAAFWHDASFPFEGTDAEIREWYADGQEARTYGAFLAGLMGAAGLIVFFGGLYAPVRRAEGGAGHLAALMVAAAAIGVAVLMVSTSLGTSIGMAFAYDDKFEAGGIDPQTVRLFSAMGFGLEAMAAAAFAVALGSVAIVSLRTGSVLARWLAWLTVAVAVLLLLNFPLFSMPYSLFCVWTVVVAGWRLFRRAPVGNMAHGVSPAHA